ncbi:hypothetical protein [Streptosporangium sp. NPDC048865]|uniref:hypothetical protein n=1 Tax=Streptosporangium sp. NPDC048865 TaxID=3155766 RepID=UPI00344629F7
MYGKRQLMVLGPALLAALAFGPGSFSPASAEPDPEQAAAVSAPQKEAATDPGTRTEDPRDYWRGYRDGYRAAAQDCRRRSRSYAGPPRDYDRGWLDGYDAGYARFCWTSN